GFGDGELDRGDVGWAGFSAVVGHGRVAEPNVQVGVADEVIAGGGSSGGVGLLGTPAGSGSPMVPASAPRMAAERSWERAVRAVCRQIPLKLRVWDWSQPKVSLPVLKVSSTGQRRPAMVMK